jgi:hypothetical protein
MAFLLSGCETTHRSPKMNTASTKRGEPILLSAKTVWHFTGRQLEEGKVYRISSVVAPGEPYLDKNVPCTPEGPVGRKGRFFDWLARDARAWYHPLRWLGPGRIKRLRVLTDRSQQRASFLTLIGTIRTGAEPDDSAAHVFVIGPGREIKAPATGELVIFANDWPGGPGTEGDARFTDSKTYENNRGALKVTVEEIPPTKS